jgi:hypothetical protein
VIASPDHGETWTLILNQPEMRIVHSIVADRHGYIYIGTYASYPPGGSLLRIRDVPPWKLQRPTYTTDWPFYYAQIRDIRPHYGMRWSADWKVISSLKSFSKSTVLIVNNLNSTVTVTIQGSWYKDFRWYDTPAVWNISSITVNPGERTKISINEDHFLYIRCQVVAQTAPTSGTIDIWIIKKN